MNVLGAVAAGIAGTAAMSILMAVGPMMGMPKMDIPGMLGTMFGKPNRPLGWILHLMMGSIFAIIYAYLWSAGIGSPTLAGGAVFGAVHWLIAGAGMAMIPMMHTGIRSGEVNAPGMWMTKQGGMMSFVGGLIGHIVFGLVVVLVYNSF